MNNVTSECQALMCLLLSVSVTGIHLKNAVKLSTKPEHFCSF